MLPVLPPAARRFLHEAITPRPGILQVPLQRGFDGLAQLLPCNPDPCPTQESDPVSIIKGDGWQNAAVYQHRNLPAVSGIDAQTYQAQTATASSLSLIHI